MIRFLALCFVAMMLCVIPVQADIYYGNNLPLNSSNIVAAGTTTIVNNTDTNLRIYVWWAAVQATGTNTSATVILEYGTGGTGCPTGTTPFPGTQPVAIPAAAPTIQTLIAGSASTAGMSTVASPVALPKGASLCGLSAGTVSFVYSYITTLGP